MEIFLTSIIAFTSTNIDDIFILMLFFGDRRYRARDIYFGQYLGVIALIAVSLIGSLIGNFVEAKYIGLLGLFPIYLGVRQIIDLVKGRNNENDLSQEEKKTSKTGILSVATVTFANGGDNIGTYVPLFATLTATSQSIMIVIFLMMVFVWVKTAKYLTTHPMLAKVISKYGHVITPVVLCLLGLWILKENDSVALLKYLVETCFYIWE